MQKGARVKRDAREREKGETAVRSEVQMGERLVGEGEERRGLRKVVEVVLREDWHCSGLAHCEQLGRRLKGQPPMEEVAAALDAQPEVEVVPAKWWMGEGGVVPLD